MKIYTRKGDDGSTGLFFGGRVSKDSAAPEAYGAVDEAQAAIGVARAGVEPGSEIDVLLVEICRDLYVVMAELATLAENAHKLEAGKTLATAAMIEDLEAAIDRCSETTEMPTEFVIPGQSAVAASLDLARTIVRRAERRSLVVAAEGSHVIGYLNRLSDLLWILARSQEQEWLLSASDD